MDLKKNKFNKLQIALSASGHMVVDLYPSFVIGLIPVLTRKFGLSLFMVGLLTSVTMISNSLTQPIFGYLSDKHGQKYFMVSGPLFAAIFISMIGVMPNYCLVLVILFLGNLSVSAYHPPSAAAAGHYGGSRKSIGNSIISFGGNFGYSIGSLFVIVIVEKLGLSFTPVAMIPGIIASLILLKLIPAETIKEKLETKIKFSKIKKIKKVRLIKLFLIFFTSYSRDLLWIVLLTFTPLYFTNSGTSLLNIGYILLAFGLLGGIGGLFSGYYADKLGNKKSSFVIQFGLIAALPLIYFTFKTTGIVSIILFVLGGFFLISTLPLCIRLSQDIFPRNMGLASSLVMGLSAGSAGVTMIFLGKVADYIGFIRTINYALILPVVALLLLTFFPKIDKE